MKVSFFKNLHNTIPTENKDVVHYLERIKSGTSEHLVKLTREAKDKPARDLIKKKLPGVCFAGQFKARAKDKLIKASGLAILDFDGHTNAEQLKSEISASKYVFSVWISPSGNGVKVLVKIPPVSTNADYTSYIKSIYDHFPTLSDFADTGTCDVSRFCYESHDPEIFINPDSECYTDRKEEVEAEKIPHSVYQTNIPLSDQNEIADRLMKWFNKRFTGQNRNTNLHALARQFNAFGVDRYTCLSYLLHFEQSDFKQKEIESLIKSAYKYTSEANTQAFEDNKAKKQIAKLLVKGESEQAIKGRFGDTEGVEKEIQEQKESIDIDEFWYYSDRGGINLAPFRFSSYLRNKNIYKFYPSSGDSFVFIQKEGNFIDEITTEKIKDMVLNDLKARCLFEAWDMMASRTQYFSKEFLSMIDTANIAVSRDGKDFAMIYYQNKAVKVTQDKFKLIDYDDIDGFVWKQQVIDRDISLRDESDGVYKRFVWLVSGEDPSKYFTLKSVIGYLLHSFKDKSRNRAIIFNDELISEEPNGGSGKGLFHKAISMVKKLSTIDGKSFDYGKNFAFQTINPDSQVILFDDVKKGFNFENLFSIITEELHIEKKGKDPIVLRFEDSPKITITTNYTIKAEGGSSRRRMFEVEMSAYFNDKNSPEQEFGHLLFDDWDKKEWVRFDNYMLRSIQYFLSNGLVQSEAVNLDLRKLIGDTSLDFVNWMDTQDFTGQRYYKSDLKNKFCDDYEDYNSHRWFTSTLFNKWVKRYCEFKGYELDKGASNGQRYISILAGENQESEYPF